MNNAWKEAKIASLISKFPDTDNGVDMIDLVTDMAHSINTYLPTLNLDRRLVAIGSEDDRQTAYDVLSQPGSEFYEIMCYAYYRAVSMMLLTGKAKKVLFNNPTVMSHVVSCYGNFIGVESIGFVNNVDLVFYEQCIRNNVEGAINEYDVYDRDDLGSHIDEKFDFIITHGLDVVCDFELLGKFTDSLNSGGKLFISTVGKGRNYFNDAYFASQFYHLHKFLHEKNGSTFHTIDVGGVTTFIKH